MEVKMKKLAVATMIIGISMSLAGCNISTATYNNKNITVEEAEEIALKHANLTNSQVSFMRNELDFDDGVKKYDIEFYFNNIEYSYEIDANTGHILKYERD